MSVIPEISLLKEKGLSTVKCGYDYNLNHVLNFECNNSKYIYGSSTSYVTITFKKTVFLRRVKLKFYSGDDRSQTYTCETRKSPKDSFVELFRNKKVKYKDKFKVDKEVSSIRFKGLNTKNNNLHFTGLVMFGYLDYDPSEVFAFEKLQEEVRHFKSAMKQKSDRIKVLEKMMRDFQTSMEKKLEEQAKGFTRKLEEQEKRFAQNLEEMEKRFERHVLDHHTVKYRIESISSDPKFLGSRDKEFMCTKQDGKQEIEITFAVVSGTRKGAFDLKGPLKIFLNGKELENLQFYPRSVEFEVNFSVGKNEMKIEFENIKETYFVSVWEKC